VVEWCDIRLRIIDRKISIYQRSYSTIASHESVEVSIDDKLFKISTSKNSKHGKPTNLTLSSMVSMKQFGVDMDVEGATSNDVTDEMLVRDAMLASIDNTTPIYQLAE